MINVTIETKNKKTERSVLQLKAKNILTISKWNYETDLTTLIGSYQCDCSYIFISIYQKGEFIGNMSFNDIMNLSTKKIILNLTQENKINDIDIYI